MKRILILILVISMLLCGCGKDKNVSSDSKQPVSNNNAEQPTDSELTVPTYEQQSMVAVSLPVVYETTQSDDGITLCQYAYQNIYLVVQDQQIADTIIIDFLNRQDAHHNAAKLISDQAISVYADHENWTPYQYKSLYSPTRVDYNVMSLYGENATILGAGNPQIECIAANYNMVSGDVLTLGSILYDIDASDKLCDLVIEHMAQIKESAQLYDGYEDVVRQRFSREASYDEDWFFTNNGLSFFFTPYEVAPYVTGVVTVEVPYSELTGVIADEFFPLEKDSSAGVVHAQLLKDTDLEQFTQIAEVPLNEVGEHIFLYCNGLVRDVKVELGTWDESGKDFTPTCTVFATFTLTPGDGIMIQSDIPDTLPNLRLSYSSGDQIVSTFISQSGKDGSVLLIDNF